MSELHMDSAEAIRGVVEASTADALFKHLQIAFGISGDIQKNIDSLERLESLLPFYTAPNISILDLHAAQNERWASTPEAHAHFISDTTIKELIIQKERALSSGGLKKELTELGESVCGEKVHKILSLYSESTNNAEKEKTLLSEIQREKYLYVHSTFRTVEEKPQYKALRQKISEVNKKQDVIRAVYSGKPFSESSEEFDKAMDPLWDERRALYDELNAFQEQFLAQTKKEAANIFDEKIRNLETAYASAKQKQEDQEAALFSLVTEQLLTFSGITQEQADAWVERNIFIAENGEAKLKRIGYPPERLKKDLAEFYRYIGGKIGPISFILEGRSQRAFARGKATIALQGDFSKRTLFHECAHLVEHWDSTFGGASKNFIESRAEGKPVSLKKLTGAGYRPDEKAYPDHFIHPYVGKIYSTGSTEVLSMGLECLSSPQALAHVAMTDPEHFKLTMGICRRQNPFLREKLEQATEILTANAKKQNRLAEWEKALSKVSGTEFGKRLDSMTGGYMGYWIDRRGRSGVLWGPPEGKDPRSPLVDSGSLPSMRALAYLLIGHATGKLYTEIPLEGGARQIILFFRNGTVPEWFDPQKSLPKV